MIAPVELAFRCLEHPPILQPADILTELPAVAIIASTWGRVVLGLDLVAASDLVALELDPFLGRTSARRPPVWYLYEDATLAERLLLTSALAP